MSKPDFRQAIQTIQIDVETASSDALKTFIGQLINLFEIMASRMDRLEEENQKLKDEVNRLKGEQGKPDIRPQTKNRNISSEDERRQIRNKKNGHGATPPPPV